MVAVRRDALCSQTFYATHTIQAQKCHCFYCLLMRISKRSQNVANNNNKNIQ